MRDDFPIVEIFGPTLQGEGPNAGVPTMFVRFGGCDYRCSWCDSMHAVDPRVWPSAATYMRAGEIADELELLGGGASWVTLSGGNPALYELDRLVDELQSRAYLIAVETQGSRWRSWLAETDMLVVSPKPPSSGMDRRADQQVDGFLIAAGQMPSYRRALKIVVRDEDDLEWSKRWATGYRDWPFYLSACSPVRGHDWPDEAGEEELRLEVARRYAELAELVLADPVFAHATVLPQLHVIAWGSRLGV